MDPPSLGRSVLVVDDDSVTREILRKFLENRGYTVRAAESGEQALQLLQEQPTPLVLSDVQMLGLSGLELLAQIRKLFLHPVVVLMTSFGSLEGAMESIRQGAFDYVTKPLKLEEVAHILEKAYHHWERSRRPLRAKEAAEVASRFVGRSPQMVEVYKTVARVALVESNVLILGESGTGKELVARSIHENSCRCGEKFVTVNCGALAETLLESELFGHVRGAFTGAIASKVGLFEEADGGTIFLDEIGDISPALQVKLLRVLQEGEFKPVGSSEPRRVDVRVVSATHRNLARLSQEGKFRDDLYYRLKVLQIELPPLRDRLEDIPDLVRHFLGRYARRGGKQVTQVSAPAMDLLMSYGWPGNVRELEHALERAVAMTRTTIVMPEDLPPELMKLSVPTEDLVPAAEGFGLASLEEVERAHIARVLHQVGYNKSRAAEILGIDRATLYRKAQKYRITMEALSASPKGDPAS